MTEHTEDNGNETNNDASDSDAGTEFRENLEELDTILESLQGGDLELEDSLEQYETAIELLRECKEILNQSEQKIEELRKEGEEVFVEPFEPEDLAEGDSN